MFLTKHEDVMGAVSNSLRDFINENFLALFTAQTL